MTLAFIWKTVIQEGPGFLPCELLKLVENILETKF